MQKALKGRQYKEFKQNKQKVPKVHKCGICGKPLMISEIVRDEGSSTGYLCIDCYTLSHPEYESNEY